MAELEQRGSVSRLSLSLCMIVRNERANLPRCLESVRAVVDEIVVVDTGSTDGTQEIARQHGARVFEAEWPNDFSLARNLAVERARGRWILILDADEFLSPESREQIKALSHELPVKAFELVQKNLDASGQHVRVQTLRLFPARPDVRYEFPIHEQVSDSIVRAGLPICRTTIEIEHTGYVDGSVHAGKAERNRAIIEAAIAKNPVGTAALHLRYYRAGTFYDEKNWPAAAAEYEQCVALSAPNSRLVRIGRLRAAECHFLTGHMENARRFVAAAPESDLHPAELCLGADLALRRGDSEEACRWFELVLAAPDIAYVPPVTLGKLKLKALGNLGSYWGNRGRKDVGVKLLRLALEIKNGVHDGGSVELAGLYRNFLSEVGVACV